MKNSFIEKNARERALAVLDEGTFNELLGPFEKIESPHLAPQDIVPQSDDGVVIARGTIAGKNAVVVSMEGAFQGGGIGEVSGAKFAGALELALRDNEKGKKTYPVVLFDTGGVRLQEANYGLLAISEIQSAVVALRKYVPVVGVIPGKIGCFGGMSMTAGLFSTLIITPQGRLTLNGPEVIEQEAGVVEFDSKNKSLIWNTLGGIQRQAVGLCDVLAEDDEDALREAVQKAVADESKKEPRSRQIDLFLSRLQKIDPNEPLTHLELREMWKNQKADSISWDEKEADENTVSRGRTWFEALTGIKNPKVKGAASVLCKDAVLGDETVRYISVVPDKNARFYRARHGEVGLLEGWTIAKYIREAIEEDKDKKVKRPIIAIVDVPSQAYGYKEELLGIFQSCAAAVDAYATARQNGHPVISFIVGKAISGAFLAHGYQGNRLIALDDDEVLIHAMSKQSAARITKRTVAELEEAAKKVPSIAYDIRSYSTIGSLHELIEGVNADNPTKDQINTIKDKLNKAVLDVRKNPNGLKERLTSAQSQVGRAASIKVRKRLEEEWK